MSLEATLTETAPASPPPREQKLKSYFVDTATAISFYQPFIGVYELAQGIEPYDVFWNRALGAAYMAAGVGKGLGWWRNHAMKITGTTQESPDWKKMLVESAAMFTYQVPIYSSILAARGYDLERILPVVLPGAALCTLASKLYGKYQDKIRTYFGMKPAIQAEPTGQPPREYKNTASLAS